MMRSVISAVSAAVILFALPASAAIVNVSGPLSSSGTSASIVAAPADVLDDVVTNSGMQGFNEAQDVLTTVNHSIDGGGFIADGMVVDSHMIFLNSAGTGYLSHFGVEWTFDGIIIGIMSDSGGLFEAASTFELGAPGTNYTTTFAGSGPAAPFPARGLEGNNGTGLGADGYTLLAANVLRVGMEVTEPGDWIRVITLSPIPLPATLPLFIVALGGLGFVARRRMKSA